MNYNFIALEFDITIHQACALHAAIISLGMLTINNLIPPDKSYEMLIAIIEGIANADEGLCMKLARAAHYIANDINKRSEANE